MIINYNYNNNNCSDLRFLSLVASRFGGLREKGILVLSLKDILVGYEMNVYLKLSRLLSDVGLYLIPE